MSEHDEVIHLPCDIPGIGKRGDCIVIMPDHSHEPFRLTRVEALDPTLLPMIRDAVRGKQPTAETTTENRYLRLKFDGEYDNGDPYKDYELLMDAPMVPATRSDVEGPSHAIKGDLLRVIDDGDEFSLRRGNKRISNPEWWQVRHLFVGLRGTDSTQEEEEGAAEAPVDPALARLHRLSPDEPERDTHCFLATCSIPDTIVRAGDYLTFRTRATQKDPKVSGAVVVRVPRAQIVTVGKHFDTLQILHVHCYSGGHWSVARMLESLRRSLRRPQNPKWNEATSPLIVIRPLVSAVSQPIEAGSDDGAIFELLASVGGAMPKEVAL